MILDSYYFGLCRFGFHDLCDDWGTNRVICGYGIRICGVEWVLDFVSVGFFFFFFFLWLICAGLGNGGRWWPEGGWVGGLWWLGYSGALTVCIHLTRTVINAAFKGQN